MACLIEALTTPTDSFAGLRRLAHHAEASAVHCADPGETPAPLPPLFRAVLGRG